MNIRPCVEWQQPNLNFVLFRDPWLSTKAANSSRQAIEAFATVDHGIWGATSITRTNAAIVEVDFAGLANEDV